MYWRMCRSACPRVHIWRARGQHWVSSFRALYLIYCNSISLNLKLAVLNRKNGQEESQIRHNTEVRLMGTGKQNSGHHTCWTSTLPMVTAALDLIPSNLSVWEEYLEQPMIWSWKTWVKAAALQFSSSFYCTTANCSSYAFSEMLRCSLKYLYSSCLELKEHEISIMILVPKADSLHYNTHLIITWSLEMRWTAEFTLWRQRLHCGWGGGRQPWKTLSQNMTCRSEHENCPAVCWYFVCGVLNRNESAALGTFPPLTDNLLGMIELFLHRLAAQAQQNAERENTV